LIGADALLFQHRHAVNAALDASAGRWSDIGFTGRWLLNAHPKSGIHLMRNILLHFNSSAVFQQLLFYDDFATAVGLKSEARLYWAHLPYMTFASATAGAENFQSILLLRHPCAVALALARAFYDVNTSRADHLAMRQTLSFRQIVAHIISGYEFQDLSFAPLTASLTEFCTDWLGHAQFILRFEDLTERLQSDDAALVGYLQPLLATVCEAVPSDAAARIRAGAATAISATYSRTRPWASTSLQAQDVFALVPRPAAAALRDVAGQLGYD